MVDFKRWSINSGSVALGGAVLAGGLILTAPSSVSAQAAYGSYVGVGVSVGLTSDANGDGSNIAGLVAARYKLLRFPISLRAQGFFSDESAAVVPTVSYDFPINFQTDVYLGIGAAFGGGTTPSTIGDDVAFAIQPGVDFALPNSDLVVFGNAVIAFDAFDDGGGTAASLQGGVGLRF
ncbi:MAG: hypothetical protein F6K19_04250 [Cyanothece sp. SIO1E1]|nr:hypothetical protein [Cyanothece sp. SIO1E1]